MFSEKKICARALVGARGDQNLDMWCRFPHNFAKKNFKCRFWSARGMRKCNIWRAHHDFDYFCCLKFLARATKYARAKSILCTQKKKVQKNREIFLFRSRLVSPRAPIFSKTILARILLLFSLKIEKFWFRVNHKTTGAVLNFEKNWEKAYFLALKNARFFWRARKKIKFCVYFLFV